MSGAARIPFAGAGRPAAAEEPLETKPAEGSSQGSWWRSEVGKKDARSSGPSEPSGSPSLPGAVGSESKTPPPSNFSSGRRKGQGLGLAERRARDPDGFPRRQPVLRFSGSGEGAAAEAALAVEGGAAALRFPRLSWEVPASRPERPASGPTPGVERGRLLTAHSRPGAGAGPRGRAPVARAHLDPPARR